MARLGTKDGVVFGLPERGKDSESRPAPGRVCTYEDCSTVLSTYNSASACWLHAEPSYKRTHPTLSHKQ